MSVQLSMPVERSLLSADPVHQINDLRSLLNVLGDPQVLLFFICARIMLIWFSSQVACTILELYRMCGKLF